MPPRDPRRSYVRVGSELDALLEGWADRVGSAQCVDVPTDVFVTDDPPSVTVQLDAAGIDPSATTVSLEEGTLVVSGHRMPPRGGRRKYQQAEIEWGPFERRVRIGVPVDADRASASYERGVLTISLPVVDNRATPGGRVVVLRVRGTRG